MEIVLYCIRKSLKFYKFNVIIIESQKENSGICDIYRQAAETVAADEEEGDFMKICKNCGAVNSDDHVICSECGKELEASDATQQAQTSPPEQEATQNKSAYAPPPVNQQGQPSFFAQPVDNNPYGGGYSEVIQNAKNVLSSPLMLSSIVLLIVQAVFSIVTSVFTSRAVINQSQALTGTSVSYHASPISLFISVVPLILFIAGLLMIYFSAKKAHLPMSTSGFTMLRVINIVLLVLLCICIVFALILSLVCILGGSAIADQLSSVWDFKALGGIDIAALIKIIGFLFLAIAFVGGALSITWLASSIQMFSSMQQTFQTGFPSSKGAGVFSVFCYIMGCLTVIGVLIASVFSVIIANNSILTSTVDLTNVLKPSAYIFSIVANVLGAVIYFVFGALASKYKRAIGRY